MDSHDPPRAENPPTVLVIDDEAGMREGCRRALAPAGYVVSTAVDVASSLELIEHTDIDVYLIDVMLPDGSGLDLLTPILDKNPEAVCIIITGLASVEIAVEAVRQGAFDFLSKPFTSDELLVSVGQGLERRRLRAIEEEARELAEAKEDLEKLDQVKSQLMLTVAHELRAPVAAVLSYVNLIQTGYVPESEMNATLTRVQGRLEEMLDLIADLLELAQLRQARLSDGRQPLAAKPSPQDMAGILEEVSELLGEQAAEKGQKFEIDIRDRPVIVADREHMKQIWTNLISNAIKYTPECGRVCVRLEADETRATGTIEDSGIGIGEDDLPHLFQDFFRTSEAKASGEIGTGLGLSIVKQIVDSYGGQIEVDSALGKGTRFTFSLPLKPDPKSLAEEEAAKSVPSVRHTRQASTRPEDRAASFILNGDASASDELEGSGP